MRLATITTRTVKKKREAIPFQSNATFSNYIAKENGSKKNELTINRHYYVTAEAAAGYDLTSKEPSTRSESFSDNTVRPAMPVCDTVNLRYWQQGVYK